MVIGASGGADPCLGLSCEIYFGEGTGLGPGFDDVIAIGIDKNILSSLIQVAKIKAMDIYKTLIFFAFIEIYRY